MNSLLGYQARVSTIRRQVQGAMEIALFIQNIQEERNEVALFIFANQSATTTLEQREKYSISSQGLYTRFMLTDRALEDVPTWPNIDKSVTAQKVLPKGTIGVDGSEAFKSKLKFQIQHEVF